MIVVWLNIIANYILIKHFGMENIKNKKRFSFGSNFFLERRTDMIFGQLFPAFTKKHKFAHKVTRQAG